MKCCLYADTKDRRYLQSETRKVKDTKYNINPFFTKGSINNRNVFVLGRVFEILGRLHLPHLAMGQLLGKRREL